MVVTAKKLTVIFWINLDNLDNLNEKGDAHYLSLYWRNPD